MRLGDKRYRILESCDLQELEFRGHNELGYIFHDQNRSEVILWKQAVDQLYISYRMALTDLEYVLRGKISTIHEKLRELNVKFDPIGSVSAVYKYSSAYFEPVHRYNKSTGIYIDSFSSISEAYSAIGASVGGAISHVCHGKRYSAYGYRWSYKKVSKL